MQSQKIFNFGKALSSTFNCSNKRCECCHYLLINDHYTFKDVQITFKLKNRFTCDNFLPYICRNPRHM